MKYLVSLTTLLCISVCAAQVSVTDLSLTYTEDFDNLPISDTSQEDPWVDNGTLPNWFAENKTVMEALNIRYGGTRATGGSSGRGLYSYGDRDVPEMALGVITTNTSDDITFGVKYRNQSGKTIESVTVSYTGEQWRISNGQQPQVLGFSYLVSGSDPTIAIPERTSGYTYVPELFFTSPKFDTTGLNLAGATGIPLDGSISENQTEISFTFNVIVADGEYLLLRWYKENTNKIEFGLAIDDLAVNFSNTEVSELAFSSNASIYHYISGPIDLRIPDDNDVESYDPPTTTEAAGPDPEETAWRALIQDLLAGNYNQARTDAPNLGYQLITFTDGTNSNKLHYVLRHDGRVDNIHHWGTFIFNTSPTYTETFLSIPHPVHDSYTARQGGYLYQLLDVAGIQIAGNYRCSSDVASGCHGETEVCTGITDFRESDASHSEEHPFHYTSEEIADAVPNSYFIQLHGFAHVGGDPDLIVSNGSDQAPSGSDRVVDFVSHVDNNSSFDAVGVHSDDYTTKLTGYTNTLGRYLNAHQGDICSSNQIADNSTDRFIHVEQRAELREIESNYGIVSNALESILTTSLPLELISFSHDCTITACHLDWETMDSYNVDRIEVHGSKNGNLFDYLGMEQAINQPGLTQYHFPLTNNQHQYYQLKTVDFDGRTEWHPVLRATKSVDGIKVYPNTFEDHIEVVAPLGSKLSLFNLKGIEVASGTVTSSPHRFEFTNLNRGTYLIQVGESPLSIKITKR